MTCTAPDHETKGTKFCPDCGERLQPDPVRIDTIGQLQELARTLRVRPDWHEPDEQEVTARVFGQFFDNAGFWPYEPNGRYESTNSIDSESLEMYVELLQAGKVVAQINLATLFAMACHTRA
jgi:hypothetical protein